MSSENTAVVLLVIAVVVVVVGISLLATYYLNKAVDHTD